MLDGQQIQEHSHPPLRCDMLLLQHKLQGLGMVSSLHPSSPNPWGKQGGSRALCGQLLSPQLQHPQGSSGE